MNHQCAQVIRPRGRSRALIMASSFFWPVFLLLTILEEKAGMAWLHTGDAAVWCPVAIAALILAGMAPLFVAGNLTWKIRASIYSLLGFAVTYGLVVLIGVSFLNWGD